MEVGEKCSLTLASSRQSSSRYGCANTVLKETPRSAMSPEGPSGPHQANRAAKHSGDCASPRDGEVCPGSCAAVN